MGPSIVRKAYLGHRKDRARIDGLWEQFHSAVELSPDESDNYTTSLLADWARCKEMGVDPTLRRVPVVEGDSFAILADSRKFLTESAEAVLGKIQETFVEVPGLILFGDQDGTILQVLGDSRMRLRAANRSNITEGGRWNEATAGTNGLGTPIALKKPVHIYSSEHYCESFHMWSCAGAPILDPFTNEVLGVIDFSTYGGEVKDGTILLACSLAQGIMSEIGHKRELDRIRLGHEHDLVSAKFPADHVVVFDHAGNVVKSNTADEETWARHVLEARSHGEGNKEACKIFRPGSDSPIGTLVIRKAERNARHFVQRGRSSPDPFMFGDFLTQDPRTIDLLEQIGKVAKSDVNVLLIGETGTGKELIASYLHEQSKRKGEPFVAINCGAINKELFESTFFGYERGAFTGADTRGRRGLFEAANGGTLLLDEIGEMPLAIQAGLLRVLETRLFRRIGSNRELETNCRVVAATNQPLMQLVPQGKFRSDLYYRLGVFKFSIPPLRERKGDIPHLLAHFIKTICRKHGFARKDLTLEALDALTQYVWPGNVRELRNVVESACVLSERHIGLTELPEEVITTATVEPINTEDEEVACAKTDNPADEKEQLIIDAIRKHKRIMKIAEALGMSRATLYRRFQSLGIDYRAIAKTAKS